MEDLLKLDKIDLEKTIRPSEIGNLYVSIRRALNNRGYYYITVRNNKVIGDNNTVIDCYNTVIGDNNIIIGN